MTSTVVKMQVAIGLLLMLGGISSADEAPKPNAAPAKEASPAAGKDAIAGGVVMCNHWTQFGIGESFPEGEVNGRWYRRNFSMVFNLEQGRRWTAASPENRVCHELDTYFLDSLAKEDPEYLNIIRKEIEAGRMELVGGMYGQAESQVFGYESAIRQMTMGQAASRRHLDRPVSTYLVEEQNFYTQLPQILKQAGFRYASLQFHNSGTLDHFPTDLIQWEATDGTTMLTVPPHPGISAVDAQRTDYALHLKGIEGRPARLIFQWMELWVPGLDWGASLEPYEKGVHGLAGQGIRQMVLSEYIDWARERVDPPRVRIPMDKSNYNNNFFGGGWGYENERTARGSNRCESLLLAAESIAAVDREAAARIQPKSHDLWAALLVSQCHDPYLAGGTPSYIDGMRSFMSELCVGKYQMIRRTLQQDLGLGEAIPQEGKKLKLFNPCPWAVATPVSFAVDSPAWPERGYVATGADGKEQPLVPLIRDEEGNVSIGPLMVNLPAYGIQEVTLRPNTANQPQTSRESRALDTADGGHTWRSKQPAFEGVVFEPLVGQWQPAPFYGYMSPNVNAEAIHDHLETSPITRLKRVSVPDFDVSSWHNDLMRIRNVPEPALAIDSTAVASTGQNATVEFQHRLSSVIRFATGARPLGTWRFRLRVPAGLNIFADSPYGEEERKVPSFYCSRYVRLEWPGRQLLWCPSQNTLFRRTDEKDGVTIDLVFMDFPFQGTANWGMRFYAGKSFSAAQSMRLAETFHRSPTPVAAQFDPGPLQGISVDRPDVFLAHVFPAFDGKGIALRVLNASDQRQPAAFRWLGHSQRVALADLDGKPLEPEKRLPVGPGGEGWNYELRPWEIVTFYLDK